MRIVCCGHVLIFLALLLLGLVSFSNAESSQSSTTNTCAPGDTTCSEEEEDGFVRLGHGNNRPTLRVVMIRHGESTNNVLHEIGPEHYRQHRTPDPALTTNGQLQAQRTADYLGSGLHPLLDDIERLYVSPFLRTLLTAAPLAETLRLYPTVWTDLHEVGGVYRYNNTTDGGTVGLGGLTRSQMDEGFPLYMLPDDVGPQGWYNAQQQKETRAMGKTRVQGVFRKLQDMAKELDREGRDRTIAMVVHGDFIDFMLQAAYQIKGTDHRFPCYNTCITAFDLTASANDEGQQPPPIVLFHNSVAHLPPSLVKHDKLMKC